MTTRQLFILKCDHTELIGSLIRACRTEILGNERESSSGVRRKGLVTGWLSVATDHGLKDYCPDHVAEHSGKGS